MRIPGVRIPGVRIPSVRIPGVRQLTVLVAAVLGLSAGLTACGPAGIPGTPRQVDPVIGVAERATLGTVLTADGQTVYRYTKDGPGRSSCHGQCAQDWPPVIVTRHPDTQGEVPGRLGTLKRDDGRRQLTYNDVPLYLYIEDSPRSADANGQDVDHEWFVLHP